MYREAMQTKSKCPSSGDTSPSKLFGTKVTKGFESNKVFKEISKTKRRLNARKSILEALKEF